MINGAGGAGHDDGWRWLGRWTQRQRADPQGRTDGLADRVVLPVPILFAYSAWLTSVVFCASNGPRPLLIADAAFFPVGVVHGIGLWFGGW